MKRVITLLIVLGMVFAASQALAWTWETAEGGAVQWNAYETGNWTQEAGGMNLSAAGYFAEGPYVAAGYAQADGATYALKGAPAKNLIVSMGGYDVDGPYKAAGACGWNSSEADAYAPFCGDTETDVYGAGIVFHETELTGSTGGATYGVATWEYEGSDEGYIYSHSEGFGGACTGGITWKSSYANGMGSHARSFSAAGSFAN